MPLINLDHNATTPVDAAVLAALLPFLGAHAGNPSSGHALADAPAAALARAHAQLALLLGADPSEVAFCSCASESVNAVVKGLAFAHLLAPGSGSDGAPFHIVTSAAEHVVVLEAVAWLEAAFPGRVRVTRLLPRADGRVHADDVTAVLAADTRLVTLMHANNETGAVTDIAAVVRAVRAFDSGGSAIAVHCDASQSVGKVAFVVRQLGVDFLTVAGHKLYAPKGIGATFMRSGAPALVSLLHGASQEAGRRAGTENVAFAVGLGAAAELAGAALAAAEPLRQAGLRDRLARLLCRGAADAGLEPLTFHGPLAARFAADAESECDSGAALALPNTLSVAFRGALSSDVVRALRSTVAVSAGAACHSHLADGASVSHVLAAMGVERALAVGTLRLSLGRSTTAADVDAAAAMIVAAVRTSIVAPAPAPAVPPPASPLLLRTEPLYVRNTFAFSCTGARVLAVLDCGKDGAPRLSPLDAALGPPLPGFPFALVLDRTVAHAQGGGQPADRGVIAIFRGDAAPLLFVFRAVRWGQGAAASEAVLHYGEFAESGAHDVSDEAMAARADVLQDLPKAAGTSSTGLALVEAQRGEIIGCEARVRICSGHRVLSARLHSAGHLLDLAVRRALGSPELFASGTAPALSPGKGYHFVEAPSVEYEGAVPAEKREAFVVRLNELLRGLVAEDAETRRWHLVRGRDDEQLGALVGPAALQHYAEGKEVRLVSVGAAEGDNVCPCGGTHVDRAGQLVGVTVTRIKVQKNATKLSYAVA